MVKIAYPNRLSAAQMAKTLYKSARLQERGQKWSEMVAFLREAEAAKADVAVLSAEHFSHVDPELMARTVEEYFPNHAAGARYIAYLRPHAGSLLSHYAQQTKCGTSTRPLDRMCRVSIEAGFFLFAPRILAWSEQFPGRFTLRPMIRSRLEDGDVVQDFLSVAVQGAPIRTKGIVRTNESLTVQQLAALREIQTVLRNKEIVPKMRVAVGQNLGVRLAKKGAMGGDKLRLSKAVVREVATHLRDDACQIDAFLGGEPLFVPALEETADNATEVQQPHLMADYAAPQAITELRKLTRRLAGQLGKPNGKAWKKMHHAELGQAPVNIPEDSTGAGHVADTLDRILETISGSIGKT